MENNNRKYYINKLFIDIFDKLEKLHHDNMPEFYFNEKGEFITDEINKNDVIEPDEEDLSDPETLDLVYNLYKSLDGKLGFDQLNYIIFQFMRYTSVYCDSLCKTKFKRMNGKEVIDPSLFQNILYFIQDLKIDELEAKLLVVSIIFAILSPS